MLSCGDALHLNMTIFDAVDGRYSYKLLVVCQPASKKKAVSLDPVIEA